MRDLGIALAICGVFHRFPLPAGQGRGDFHDALVDDQERIFINKFVYRIEPIQRGDIVVFRYPATRRRALSNV
jgi:signal peptidase I